MEKFNGKGGNATIAVATRLPILALRRKQRRQPPCHSRLIAALMRLAVLPRKFKLAAHRGAFFVNRATDAIANGSFERDTTRTFLIRAFHHDEKIIELFRQFRRHGAAGRGIGFGPIK